MSRFEWSPEDIQEELDQILYEDNKKDGIVYFMKDGTVEVTSVRNQKFGRNQVLQVDLQKFLRKMLREYKNQLLDVQDTQEEKRQQRMQTIDDMLDDDSFVTDYLEEQQEGMLVDQDEDWFVTL